MTTTGRVRLQHCADCVRWYVMPRTHCPGGAEHELRVLPVAGHGTVYSHTVTHQAMHPSYGDRVPYRTVLVELAEGPRVLAVVPDQEHEIEIGMLVSVVDAEPDDAERAPTSAMLAAPAERGTA